MARSNHHTHKNRLHVLATCLAIVAAVAVGRTASADNLVVPNAWANTPGENGNNTLVLGSGGARTYQIIMDDSHFASIPMGSLITGLQWRAPTGQGAAHPATDITFSDYDMFLAPAALPVGSMSTTFANNVGPGELQVRNGALTFAANSFVSSDTGASPWGPAITFDTPYAYTGGDLVFTARHTGADVAHGLFLDALMIPTGLANGLQALSGTGASATTGSPRVPVIFNFTYTPIPGPSALALMGLAGLVGPRRRRWRR